MLNIYNSNYIQNNNGTKTKIKITSLNKGKKELSTK